MSAQPFRQQFLRVLGGSTGIYLFGTAMAFFVGVQLARGLGVAGYGLYGSAMAAASFGATFAAGGLQLHATRDLSAHHAQGDHKGAARLVEWSLRNVFALGVAAALAAGAYVRWGLDGAATLTGATMLATALIALLTLVGAIMRGAGQVVLGQALDTAIRPTAQSILLLVAVVTFGVIEADVAMALTFTAVLVALPFSWRTVARIWRVADRGEASAAEARGWGKASATMGLTTVTYAAESAIPLIVVGALSSLEQAGLFRVATAIMVFSNMPVSMLTVMVPAMASSLYQRGDIEQLRRLSTASAFAILVPTLAIAGCLWLVGETLLALAFGSDYRTAWLIVSVLAGASVVNAMGGVSINLLHAARQDAVVSRAYIISLIVTCTGLVVAALDGAAVSFALAVSAGILVRTVFLIVSTLRLVGIDPTIFGAFRTLAGR